MAGRGRGWLGGAGAAMLGGLVSLLSVWGGDRDDAGGRLPVERNDATHPEAGPDGGASGDRAQGFGESVGRLLRNLGEQGDALRGRVEGLYGMYRLLRALGMTDQEIAALVAREASSRLQRGLRESTPTTGDVRQVVDGLQELVLHAAEDVDERLDLGGDFVRRVREGVQATRAGREDALIALDRGVGTARDQLRRVLVRFGAEGEQ